MLDCVRSLSPAPGVSYSRLKSLAQESAVHPDSSISLTSPPAYFLTPEKMHEMRGRGISLKIPISTEQKLERTPDPEPVKVQGFRWGCWGGFGLHWASVAMLPSALQRAMPCVCVWRTSCRAPAVCTRGCGRTPRLWVAGRPPAEGLPLAPRRLGGAVSP